MQHENKLLKNIQNELIDERIVLIQNQLDDEKLINENLQNRLNDIQKEKFELECKMNILQKKEEELKIEDLNQNDIVIKSKDDQITDLKFKLNHLQSVFKKKSDDNELSVKKLQQSVEKLSITIL